MLGRGGHVYREHIAVRVATLSAVSGKDWGEQRTHRPKGGCSLAGDRRELEEKTEGQIRDNFTFKG